ncbi:hypothetical protein SAMN05444158_3144 [Bradyrhizobium canariense]|uniref:Uncharacterized protein n=2 Tax=Bradyrhizobium canariense TaxID=255045 RepID=A0A1H1UXL2_9BRAD|nr:hypothetical protein SAMN05444158_3144 [Bradyrhizobium canariense]
MSYLGPIVVALLGWIAFNAIGKPLLRFFDLRTEVRRAMVLYESVCARWGEANVLASADKDATPTNFELLQEAERQYRDLAAQVRAFADTQSPTCIVLRWCGFDIRKASSGLLGLSNATAAYGKTRSFQMQAINEALKFSNRQRHDLGSSLREN